MLRGLAGTAFDTEAMPSMGKLAAAYRVSA
jgi:hypothetical protein